MAARDYIPINIDLIANPMNWIIIYLMVVIAGLGLSLIFPATPTSDN
jgi:hypothetical protein